MLANSTSEEWLANAWWGSSDMRADAIGSGGRVQKKEGGQFGKKNQVVKVGAGTSANSCNSSRSEKKMKESRQRLSGRQRSIVARRTERSVNLVCWIKSGDVGRKKKEGRSPGGKKVRSSGQKKIYRRMSNEDIGQPVQKMKGVVRSENSIRSAPNWKGRLGLWGRLLDSFFSKWREKQI